jgi:peptidoglycan/xylan/chitin deacetylase (PgdA/CDA1 family)
MPGGAELIKDLRNAFFVGAGAACLFVLGVMVMTYPEGERHAGVRAISRVFPDSDPRVPSLAEPAVQAAGPRVRGVPVLCHHYLRESTTPVGFAKILGALFFNLPLLGNMDVWTQSSSTFERQIEYLAENGYEAVGLDELVAWQRGYGTLPPRPVVITFDDGDRSVLNIALPVLERHGFKATLFVVTSKVGTRWDRVDCLDWDELRTLEASGLFSIQSHSHDLHKKVKTSRGTMPVFVAAGRGLHAPGDAHSWREYVSGDLSLSRSLLKERLGVDARYLAWPYGFANAALDSVAIAAGFVATCTLEEGVNVPQPLATSAPYRDRLELRRFTVTARTTMREFRLMVGDPECERDAVASRYGGDGFFGLLEKGEFDGP